MTEPNAPRPALVLRVDAKRCHVELDGRTLALPLRGRLFEQRGDERQPIAVGDRVLVTLDGDDGAIDSVLPRSSKIGRRGAGDDPREQVLAANVSLLLAVAPLANPPVDALLLDSILAGAEREGIDAAVAFTKADLDRAGAAGTWPVIYRDLGYATFVLSVHEREAPGWRSLTELLARHVTMVSGPSGAGKSSLVNALAPGLGLTTGAVGRTARGRHTTTYTQLLPLPSGGHVLDTPGVHTFDPAGATRDEVGGLFREIARLAGQCAYRDCAHRVEPGCAVLRELAAGTIVQSRHASYVALVQRVERDVERRQLRSRGRR